MPDNTTPKYIQKNIPVDISTYARVVDKAFRETNKLRPRPDKRLSLDATLNILLDRDDAR